MKLTRRAALALVLSFAWRLPLLRATVARKGLRVDVEAYHSNLKFITEQVLPAGWELNAVQKWDAYGHNERLLAPVAAQAGITVSVLENREARIAVQAGAPGVLRIKPANYSEVLEAALAGWGMEELVGPSNFEGVLAAAQAANATIGVHLYLFMHYQDPWGWNFTSSEQLQALVDSLDYRYLRLKGIMAYVSGYSNHKIPHVVDRFLAVACPVAQALAPTPVLLHWADTSEVLRLLPAPGQGGGSPVRMVPPQGLCTGPNIRWMARLGELTYAPVERTNKKLMRNGTSPVMLWHASVAQIREQNIEGVPRRVAVVGLGGPGRYPAPQWWPGTDAYAASKRSDQLGEPAALVVINHQRFPLAEVPRGVRPQTLLVDVTDAAPPIDAGDWVCLLCSDHALSSMGQEFGADHYNVARCLRGLPSVDGTDFWDPPCQPPGATEPCQLGYCKCNAPGT